MPPRKLPPSAYTRWRAELTGTDHYAPATCEQVGCTHHRDGWTTVVDLGTARGQQVDWWIRRQSGRVFTEAALPGGRVRFSFPAGQRCFEAGRHRRATERPPLLSRDGRPFNRAADWVEAFGEHQQMLADAVAAG